MVRFFRTLADPSRTPNVLVKLQLGLVGITLAAVKNFNKTYCFSTDPLTFCFTFFLIFLKCASRPRAGKNSKIKQNMKFLDVLNTNGNSMILRCPEVVFLS